MELDIIEKRVLHDIIGIVLKPDSLAAIFLEKLIDEVLCFFRDI